ncbi:Uncharacterised protein [Klebsiella pneumoniae]|uniref:Uncharacterized protein n=1 Tax=Klebsiella pneumoniae TaxID=573 RepID=A0A378FS74_KLEPN|nr:Uncharacterised protein [Klebsiella pneumoniae]
MAQTAAGCFFSICSSRRNWRINLLLPTLCRRVARQPGPTAAVTASHAKRRGRQDILYLHNPILHSRGYRGIASKSQPKRDSPLSPPRRHHAAGAAPDRDKKVNHSTAGDRCNGRATDRGADPGGITPRSNRYSTARRGRAASIVDPAMIDEHCVTMLILSRSAQKAFSGNGSHNPHSYSALQPRTAR